MIKNNFVELYPTLHSNIKIDHNKRYLYRIQERKSVLMRDDAWKILEYIDGVKTVSDIHIAISELYQIELEDLIHFFDDLRHRKIVQLCKEPTSNILQTIDYSGPEIASIALTDKCNLKCTYCYGNYTPENLNTLSYEKLKELFKELSQSGTSVVELTGGEPLMHPEFSRILNFACDCFNFVTVMTNGVLFTEEIFEILSKHKGKTSVRISIDGMSEDSCSLIRKTKNSCKKTLRNLEEMVHRGINVGVTYMMLYENRLELEPFCIYLRKLGIRNLMVSAPENFGRATSMCFSDGASISDRSSKYYMEMESIYEDVYSKYSDVMRYTEESSKKHQIMLIPNCGAGWKNIAIQANGDVLACQLVSDGFQFGNVYEQSIKLMLATNPITYFLSKIYFTPEKMKECALCPDSSFCGKCIMKILQANQTRLQNNKPICSSALNCGVTAEKIKIILKNNLT